MFTRLVNPFADDEALQLRIQRLDQQCDDTLRTAYHPGTQRSYKSRLNGYYRFCQFYRMKPFPATEVGLMRFTRYVANGVTSYSTVKGYLSTIKRAHELSNIPFLKKYEVLRMQMYSIRKELAVPVKKATPITPLLLVRMYSFVQKNCIIELTCFAALVIGFTLFLRKSNLVPDTQASFLPKEQLTKGDVGMMGTVMVYSITWCKTNQYRNRDLILPIIPAHHVIVSAEHWTKFLLSNSLGGDDQPLISYPKGGRMVPITYDVLSRRLKGWVKACGLNPEEFSLHGLRRGGANHALSVGICGEDLRLMGDWASDAYLEYIDLTLDRRVTNMVKFVDELDRRLEEKEMQEWEKFDEQEMWGEL